jgi:hypothetical protein
MDNINDAMDYLDSSEIDETKTLNTNNYTINTMAENTEYFGFLGIATQIKKNADNSVSLAGMDDEVTDVNQFEFIAISDESIANDLGIEYVETIASRERKGFFPGGLSVGGDFSFLAEPDNLDEVLYYAFGNVELGVDAPTGYYKKIYKPQMGSLPFFTTIINRNRLMDTKVVGAKMGSLEFTFDTGAAASVSATISAKDQKLWVPGTIPVKFGEYMPFPYYTITVMDGVTPLANVTSMTLTIENNLTADNFALGSLNTSAITEGVLAISGSMDMVFKDSTYFQRFMGMQTFSLKVECKHPNDSNLSLIFDLPKVVIETADVNMGGIETLTQTVDFTALRDAVSGYSVKAELVNKKAATVNLPPIYTPPA